MRAAQGRARGRTPLGFGGTMFSGRLVVCGARGERRKALFAVGVRPMAVGGSGGVGVRSCDLGWGCGQGREEEESLNPEVWWVECHLRQLLGGGLLGPIGGAGGGCAHSMQQEQEQGHARNERAEPQRGRPRRRAAERIAACAELADAVRTPRPHLVGVRGRVRVGVRGLELGRVRLGVRLGLRLRVRVGSKGQVGPNLAARGRGE